MAIEAGQVYRRYDRKGHISRGVRVVTYQPGADRAQVVDADSGLRPREIRVSALHETTHPDDRPQSGGYVLEPSKELG